MLRHHKDCLAGFNGFLLNNVYPGVHMLMLIDDIVVLNDSTGRLQQELNALVDFFSKYINLSKTNVTVF